LDDLDDRFRDRAVELFFFLKNVPVGFQRDVYWNRTSAFKQCLYAIETVFHSTLGYLLQLYLVHKASKRAHRHLIFDRHAGSALLLSQFFKVDCNLPALEWTFDHLGYNLAHRDIVDGLAVPFEFLAVKISANPENSANP